MLNQHLYFCVLGSKILLIGTHLKKNPPQHPKSIFHVSRLVQWPVQNLHIILHTVHNSENDILELLELLLLDGVDQLQLLSLLPLLLLLPRYLRLLQSMIRKCIFVRKLYENCLNQRMHFMHFCSFKSSDLSTIFQFYHLGIDAPNHLIKHQSIFFRIILEFLILFELNCLLNTLVEILINRYSKQLAF